MATIARLDVLLGLKDNTFTKGLDSSRNKLNSWGESLRSIGTKLTAGVTAPLVAAGVGLVKWGADLENTMATTVKVFGSATDQVMGFANTSAKSFGIAKQDALDYQIYFAGMLDQIAEGPKELANMSTELTKLTADFGAFFNLTNEEAFTVIQSALAGETEAIRRYGVDVSAAAVEQKALELGLASTTAELTEQDKALARYHLIMEQTTHMQGQFADESDSITGKLKVLQARFKDLGTSVSRHLLPYADDLLGVAEDLMGWLESLSPATQRWVIGIAAAAAALGPLLIAMGLLLPALGTGLGFIAAMISPIGLLVAAVGVLAYIFRDELADGLDTLAGKIEFATNVFQNLRATGVEPLEAAFRTLETMFPSLSGSFDGLRAVVEALQFSFDAFRNGEWEAGFQRLGNVAESAWSRIREGVSLIGSLAQSVTDWVLNVGAPAVIGTAQDIWNAVSDWVVNTAWPAVSGAAVTVGSALVSIGGWLVETASSLYDAVLVKINTWLYGGSVAGGGALAGGGGFPIGDLAVRVGGWLFTQASDIASALKSKVVEWLSGFGITSTDVITVGTAIVSAVRESITLALQSAADVASDILTWLTGQIESIDWGSLGNDVGRLLGEAIKLGIQGLVGLVALSGYLLGQLLLAVVNVDWGSLGSSIGAFLLTALEAGFEFVGGFVQGLADGLFNGLSFDTITAKGAELVQSFTNGFEIAWPATQAWLADLGNKALTAVGVMTSVLIGRGAELVQGFVNGFDIALPVVTAWLGDLGNKALEAIPELGETLKSKGAELIQGFWDGAKEVWNDFIDWLTGRDEEMGKIEPGTGGDDPNIIGSGNAFVGDWSQFPGMGGLSGLGSSIGSAMSGALESVRAAAEAGMDAVRGTIETKATEWGTTLQARTAELSGIAMTGFGQIPAVATPPLTGTGAMVASQTGLMNLSASTNWAAMLGSAVLNFAGIRTAGTVETTSMTASVGSNFSQMQAATSAKLLGMKAGAAANFLSIRSNATSEASTTNANVNSQFSSMVSRIGSLMALSVSVVRSYAAQWPGAFSGIRGSMYAAGADAIQGLVDGARSRLGGLMAVVAQAIAIFNAIPALGNSPWPMMIDAGHDAMDGLRIGVEDRLRPLGRAIDGVADMFSETSPRFAGVDMSGLSSSSQASIGPKEEHHHHYYSVTPEDLRKLIEDAREGGKFARNFGPELAMQMGRS